MTAKLISSLYQPTARGRTRMLALATAVAIAISAALGASTSLADAGSVYFDANNNAAAGETALQRDLHRLRQRRPGPRGDAQPHQRQLQPRHRLRRAVRQHYRQLQRRRPALRRCPPTPPAGNNVATGYATALASNTTGDGNVATGAVALADTTGNNIATGRRTTSPTGRKRAGLQHDRQQQRRQPASTRLLNTTGSANVAIGRNAGENLTTGSNNVDIANAGKAGEAGTIRIGTDGKQTAAFIAGISSTPLGGAAQPVVVNSNGQLGTAPQRSASTASLAATVERLAAQVERQQRQIERLREQVKGG